MEPRGHSPSSHTSVCKSRSLLLSLCSLHLDLSLLPHLQVTMSTCGDCTCKDISQCVKKGNKYDIVIVQTEESYYDTATASGENDGKCKCGPNCTCTTCTCGH